MYLIGFIRTIEREKENLVFNTVYQRDDFSVLTKVSGYLIVNSENVLDIPQIHL